MRGLSSLLPLASRFLNSASGSFDFCQANLSANSSDDLRRLTSVLASLRAYAAGFLCASQPKPGAPGEAWAAVTAEGQVG